MFRSTMFEGSLVRAAGVAVLLGLSGCGGEAGFDPEIQRVFFGLNNDGACESLTVEVDLEGSLLHHPTFRTVDCVISTDLRFDGCTADFDESDDGLTLTATITGCRIPRTSELFHCGFFSIDDEVAEAEAQCSCANRGCDRTPPLCIDDEQDPDSCERCDNGLDDDADGRTDCDDANCQYDAACEGATTTSTSTSSTASTNTSMSMTTMTVTTTTLPQLFAYKATFAFLDAVTVGSLQWTIDYSAVAAAADALAPAGRLGAASAIECRGLVDAATATFDDDPVQQQIDASLTVPGGFTGPLEVAECTFASPVEPAPEDIVLRDVVAAAPDATPIPSPDMGVDSVEVVVTTTTVPVTTTVSGPTTTTTIPAAQVSVVFRVDTASEAIGAIQWSTAYGDAPGGFVGSGAAVACTNLVSGALFAPNDDEGAKKLTLGVISLATFAAPADLVRCEFAGADATPGDFPVTIEDATNGDGELIGVTISVRIEPSP